MKVAQEDKFEQKPKVIKDNFLPLMPDDKKGSVKSEKSKLARILFPERPGSSPAVVVEAPPALSNLKNGPPSPKTPSSPKTPPPRSHSARSNCRPGKSGRRGEVQQFQSEIEQSRSDQLHRKERIMQEMRQNQRKVCAALSLAKSIE
jgi:hypothetical protein